jgi:hypothetical protein
MNAWFNTNLLSLNYNKMQYVQFRITSSLPTQLDISYTNKYIVNTNARFLGITMDNSLSWKNHTDGLMVKLNKAFYAIRSLRPFVSYESLRMIYYSYFYSVMLYGIIFWGTSSHNNNVFKLQKWIIRIITNSRNRDSCRDLFKKLNILPFYSQYIFSLLIFVIDNISLFKSNSELYEINTRNKNNVHPSRLRLSIYGNGVYYMGIKAFNHQPSYIKKLSEEDKN